MDFYNELYHFGVLGMRWGVRRYQPYSVRGRKGGKRGDDSAARRYVQQHHGESHSYSGSNDYSSRRLTAKEKKQVKQITKENGYGSPPQTLDEAKKVWAQSATTLYEHRSEYTPQELNDAVNRLNTESRLRKMKKEEQDSGRRAVEDVLKYFKTGNDIYETGARTVKNVSELTGKAKEFSKVKKETDKIMNDVNQQAYDYATKQAKKKKKKR